ncbi:MAG: mandelate racemase/muconate lactonizing enzyme family protein [Betaproteobacteria bacterium]|nr:mandelate racemase/muconate lactonizing enzyme family protein [Betaproteobacteria bacterium]
MPEADAASIRSVRTTIVTLPLDEPYEGTPIGSIKTISCLLVEVGTKGGVEGLGHLAWYNPRSARQIQSVRTLVDDLGEALAGHDGLKRAAIYQLMRGLTSESLHEGIVMMAIGAIDMALWDIAAKHAGMPLAVMLGGCRDGIPVYESSRLAKDRLADLESSADRVRADGYGAAKVLAGSRAFDEEVERIRVVRAALGPGVRLMVDCARRLTPAAAIRFARAISGFDIHWLEDPVSQADIAGLRRVRDLGGVPLATGERISGFAELEAILSAEAVDHIMLDLQRIGGPSAWLSLAPALQCRNIPLSAHGAHEFQLHLLASTPNGHYLEYHPWWNALYVDPPQPSGGLLGVGPKSGFGLELDKAAVARYRAG